MAGRSPREHHTEHNIHNTDGIIGRKNSHQLCRDMMRNCFGDTFVPAHGSVADCTGTIREILSKYLYRYQDCTQEFQVRFPDPQDIQIQRSCTIRQNQKHSI